MHSTALFHVITHNNHRLDWMLNIYTSIYKLYISIRQEYNVLVLDAWPDVGGGGGGDVAMRIYWNVRMGANIKANCNHPHISNFVVFSSLCTHYIYMYMFYIHVNCGKRVNLYMCYAIHTHTFVCASPSSVLLYVVGDDDDTKCVRINTLSLFLSVLLAYIFVGRFCYIV